MSMELRSCVCVWIVPAAAMAESATHAFACSLLRLHDLLLHCGQKLV